MSDAKMKNERAFSDCKITQVASGCNFGTAMKIQVFIQMLILDTVRLGLQRGESAEACFKYAKISATINT